jgi:hypothetical protein
MRIALRRLLLGTYFATVYAATASAAEALAPSGLVVVRHVDNSPAADRDLVARALTNPLVSGVAVQIRWSDIEPTQGTLDWSTLDPIFSAAESGKKWVQLSIYAGFFAPAWAMDGAQTDRFPVPYGPGRGKVMALPMPWDPFYLGHWFAFLKQVSVRYGQSPAFRVISAAGPTSVTAEMTLPRDPQKWRHDGYRSSKYAGAWSMTLRTYAEDFPTQFVSLTVGEALNLNDQGKLVPGEAERTRQVIIDQAQALLGRRFVLENDDLHAGPQAQHPATAFVMNYSGRTVTGLQVKCAAVLGTCSAGLGAAGDPARALTQTIDKGMRPNRAGRRIAYLEIYEPDVLADQTQAALQHAATLLAR